MSAIEPSHRVQSAERKISNLVPMTAMSHYRGKARSTCRSYRTASMQLNSQPANQQDCNSAEQKKAFGL